MDYIVLCFGRTYVVGRHRAEYENLNGEAAGRAGELGSHKFIFCTNFTAANIHKKNKKHTSNICICMSSCRPPSLCCATHQICWKHAFWKCQSCTDMGNNRFKKCILGGFFWLSIKPRSTFFPDISVIQRRVHKGEFPDSYLSTNF